MSIGFLELIRMLAGNPLLAVVSILTIGVIFVNGWTDAPNAIATCISTRSMTPRNAILMAAVFNFLGIVAMALWNTSVAMTIYNMVDFGGDSYEALIALCAALFAIVLWATAAWKFGIPTSESHALIAGISGAAIAVHGGFAGINGGQWVKVLYGLAFSLVVGFLLGFLTVSVIEALCRPLNRCKTNIFFQGAQIAAAAAMAFMHGAQDGQKFMGVFLLGIFLSKGQGDVGEFMIPLWLMVLCSLVMLLGTSVGGLKIIKTVGMDMVHLEKYQGFAADLAAAGCLLITSLTGMPVSTTHTKTTAIMGVGVARRISSLDWRIVRELFAAWVLTFPGCGLVGFLMAKLFLYFF